MRSLTFMLTGFEGDKNMKHNHTCYCGTSYKSRGHETGKDGCIRFMVEAPIKKENDRWEADGVEITDFSLRQQRGYHQFDCGCWSRWPGSSISLSEET